MASSAEETCYRRTEASSLQSIHNREAYGLPALYVKHINKKETSGLPHISIKYEGGLRPPAQED